MKDNMFYNKFEDPEQQAFHQITDHTNDDEDINDNNSKKTEKLVKIAKILNFVIVLSLIATILGFLNKNNYPVPSFYDSNITQEPKQTPTQRQPFQTEVDNITYQVNPVFDYELHGMIVSYHHSDSYDDLMHERKKDFLNINDLCVIWGDNVSLKTYNGMNFSNGDWSCHGEFKTYQAYNDFNLNQVSNNHMLADDPEIIDRLRSARVGDQIHFKGFLANYGRVNRPLSRKSSTTRTDRENGACETVYIDEFTIVRSANKSWHFLYNSGRILLLISLISAFILSWFTPVKIRLRDN